MWIRCRCSPTRICGWAWGLAALLIVATIRIRQYRDDTCDGPDIPLYLESRRTAQGVELQLTGSWRVTHLDALAAELAGVQLAGATHVLIDTTQLSALGSIREPEIA